tara:strand:- start:356 stop:718 length:363 start_codon:yes stop_codon:yes gene_type:complete
MKHLVKFNESIESKEWGDVDIEYFKNCFIEFIDKGATIRSNIFYGEYKAGYCQIDIEGQLQNKGSVEDFIKLTDEMSEMYKDIESSILKVKIKYTKVSTYLLYETNGEDEYYLSIFINKE